MVIAKQSENCEKRLVSYFVRNPHAGASSEALREFLRKKLPDYMVPSAFVALDSLPLTPHGKIDHAALPDSEEERGENSPRFV